MVKPILGPDGVPVSFRALEREVAAPELAGVRAMWDMSVASGLTPQRLAGLLREVVRGDLHAYLILAEELEERYQHYASVLSTRKRAVSQVVPVLDADSLKGCPRRVIQAVEDLLAHPDIPELVTDMLDALGKGFSATEIMWGERDGLFTPLHYVWRDPAYFTFDFVSRSQLRLAVLGDINGADMPRGKFIQHMPKLKSGIPIRSGLARICAWPFLFQQFSWKDWLQFLDIYGLPLRVGKYHPAATAEEKRALLRAVTGIAGDAAAIIPETMQMEFVSANSTGTAPFEAMCHYLDEQVSRAVIGQTLTAQHGGSLAQAKIHNEVRLDIRADDARQIAKTLNRDLLAWFVAINFGAGTQVPRVTLPTPEPEDIAVMSAALGALVPLGLRISQAEARAKIGFGAPDDDEDVLRLPAGSSAPAPPTNPGGSALIRQAITMREGSGREGSGHGVHVSGCLCGSCLALNAEGGTPTRDEPTRDEIDDLADAATADWQEVMTPIRDDITALSRESQSFAEFAAGLEKLMGSLDVSKVEQRLYLDGLKARGLGQSRDAKET